MSTGQTFADLPPDAKNLTPPQRLDRIKTLPGPRGFLLGTVAGQPNVHRVAGIAPDPSLEPIVTDYPFQVMEFIGVGRSPYPLGSTITVRVLGGTLNGVAMKTEEDVPTLVTGHQYLVSVRGQAQIAGGSSATVQVISIAGDVWDVDNGAVRGGAEWAGIAEDLPTFRRHFRP